jgi:hypothetical protein
MELGGQRHALATLPGTHWIEVWMDQRPVWKGAKNLAPNGIQSQDRQPVASRHAD